MIEALGGRSRRPEDRVVVHRRRAPHRREVRSLRRGTRASGGARGSRLGTMGPQLNAARPPPETHPLACESSLSRPSWPDTRSAGATCSTVRVLILTIAAEQRRVGHFADGASTEASGAGYLPRRARSGSCARRCRGACTGPREQRGGSRQGPVREGVAVAIRLLKSGFNAGAGRAGRDPAGWDATLLYYIARQAGRSSTRPRRRSAIAESFPAADSLDP